MTNESQSLIATDQKSDRIDTCRENEIRYWTEFFGCSRHQLLSVIKRVGNSVASVREDLQSHRDLRVSDASALRAIPDGLRRSDFMADLRVLGPGQQRAADS
jgi:hypothetical protein